MSETPDQPLGDDDIKTSGHATGRGTADADATDGGSHGPADAAGSDTDSSDGTDGSSADADATDA